MSPMVAGACVGEGNTHQGVYADDGFEAMDSLGIMVSQTVYVPPHLSGSHQHSDQGKLATLNS